MEWSCIILNIQAKLHVRNNNYLNLQKIYIIKNDNYKSRLYNYT